MGEKKAFYCNQQCTVLAELGNGDVAIEIMSSVPLYGDEEFTYEDLPHRMIVPTRHLTAQPIVVEDIREKMEAAEADARKQSRDIARDARNEKAQIEKQIEEMRKEVGKFDGLQTMFDYLNGDIKYVVYTGATFSHETGIAKLDTMMCSCTSSELAAVSFRSKSQQERRGCTVQMYVNQYSDDSGCKFAVKGFKTLEGAKEYLLGELKAGRVKIGERLLKNLDEWGIECDEITQFKVDAAEKKTKDRLAKVKKLKDELSSMNVSLEIVNE